MWNALQCYLLLPKYLQEQLSFVLIIQLKSNIFQYLISGKRILTSGSRVWPNIFFLLENTVIVFSLYSISFSTLQFCISYNLNKQLKTQCPFTLDWIFEQKWNVHYLNLPDSNLLRSMLCFNWINTVGK